MWTNTGYNPRVLNRGGEEAGEGGCRGDDPPFLPPSPPEKSDDKKCAHNKKTTRKNRPLTLKYNHKKCDHKNVIAKKRIYSYMDTIQGKIDP